MADPVRRAPATLARTIPPPTPASTASTTGEGHPPPGPGGGGAGHAGEDDPARAPGEHGEHDGRGPPPAELGPGPVPDGAHHSALSASAGEPDPACHAGRAATRLRTTRVAGMAISTAR